MRTKSILTVIAMLLLNFAYGEKEVEIRISPEFFNKADNSVYIAVEVLAQDNQAINLADMNYRLYYNSAILSLDSDESHSDLPIDKYAEVQFLERFEGIYITDINQLDFDDNLGFVNFSIDLIDNHNGGIKISKENGWQRIAILKFNLKKEKEFAEMIWSRPNVTDRYATAFVELTEWVAPFETYPLEVTNYYDGTIKLNEITAPIKISVGPNPTASLIKIDFSDVLENTSEMIMMDASGKIVFQYTIAANTDKIKVDVSSLASTMYSIEIIDTSEKTVIYSDQIAIVD